MNDPTLVVPYRDGHRTTFTYGLLSYDDEAGTEGRIVSGGSTLVMTYADKSATVSLIELYKAWVGTFDPKAADAMEVDHAST